MWPLKTFALCCISVLLLSGIVDAAPNRAKKGMIAYEESFDNVLTLGKAKSKQTRCHIRYDLERHILEVGFCDVKNVGVYTSDSIWLDDLHDPEGATNFEKGYTYRGVEGSFKAAEVAYLKVEFVFKSAAATEKNLDQITCPAGYEKEIRRDESKGISLLSPLGTNAAFCHKPYECPDGQYALDERKCAATPEHATRLTPTGFECEEGFLRTVQRKGDTTCVAKVECSPEQRYIDKDNACAELPDHATWLSEVTTPDDFVCDSPFVHAENGLKCESAPENGHRIDEKTWGCNDGFLRTHNGQCVQNRNISFIASAGGTYAQHGENSAMAIRATAGAEFLWGNRLMYGPSAEIDFAYMNKLPTKMALKGSDFRIDLGFSVFFANGIASPYARVLMAMHLKEAFWGDYMGTISVPKTQGGGELGVRWLDPHGNSVRFDTFAGVMMPRAKIEPWYNPACEFFGGIRLILF